jgi:hypothetical protein
MCVSQHLACNKLNICRSEKRLKKYCTVERVSHVMPNVLSVSPEVLKIIKQMEV